MQQFVNLGLINDDQNTRFDFAVDMFGYALFDIPTNNNVHFVSNEAQVFERVLSIIREVV